MQHQGVIAPPQHPVINTQTVRRITDHPFLNSHTEIGLIRTPSCHLGLRTTPCRNINNPLEECLRIHLVQVTTCHQCRRVLLLEWTHSLLRKSLIESMTRSGRAIIDQMDNRQEEHTRTRLTSTPTDPTHCHIKSKRNHSTIRHLSRRMKIARVDLCRLKQQL